MAARGLRILSWAASPKRWCASLVARFSPTRQGEELASTEPFRRVLVPVDIAERSVAALAYARGIAEHSKGTVYPLHIVPTEETNLLLRDVYQAREGARANRGGRKGRQGETAGN